MNKQLIQKKIDDLVKEMVAELAETLPHCIESITIVGSYGIKRISLTRPNINIFIFLKENSSAKDILKIGEIFYTVTKRNRKYFSTKIDAFPFRLGQKVGTKDLELVISPRILFMEHKDSDPPFETPKNILGVMRSTRLVMYGSDPLEGLELEYSRRYILEQAAVDVCFIFRQMQLLIPLSFDVSENIDLLAEETISYGKNALTWGVTLFLSEEDIKKKKHVEIIRDKEKLREFYHDMAPELAECADVIIDARTNFDEYRKDEKKAYSLFEASYTAIATISERVKEELRTQRGGEASFE